MPTATKTDEVTLTEDKLDRLADCPECLAGNLAWLLSQAHFAMLSELHAALRPEGITPRGYHVLVAAQTGDRTQTELAGLVGLDKTTMVVTVDELESAGLAERVPSETDRRARVISVTAEGGQGRGGECSQACSRRCRREVSRHASSRRSAARSSKASPPLRPRAALGRAGLPGRAATRAAVVHR